MAILQPIDYGAASAEVRVVYDAIMAARGVLDVNKFWKYLAHNALALQRSWDSLQEKVLGTF